MATPLLYGLECLDSTDYGAVALWMQATATAAEAALGAQLDEFNGFLSAPTAIITTTVAQTGITNGTLTTLGGGGQFAVTFANYTLNEVPAFGQTLATGSLAFPLDKRGWYHVGAYIPMTASGGVTAGSSRQAEMIFQQGSPTVIPTTIRVTRTESNTAGEHLIISGTFLAPSSGGLISAYITLLSANAASTVTVPAGAMIWLTYLGPNNQVMVP
jgi:hypothetical protein